MYVYMIRFLSGVHNMTASNEKAIVMISGCPVNHSPEAINRLRCPDNDAFALPHMHEEPYVPFEKCTTLDDYVDFPKNALGLPADEIQSLVNVCIAAYEILNNNGINLKLLLAEYIIVENNDCGRSVFKVCLVPGTYVVDHGNETDVDGENGLCDSISNILKLATFGSDADQPYVATVRIEIKHDTESDKHYFNVAAK